jgi:hypothetical protein
MRRRRRIRVAPRPGGFYLQYLNDLIERNQAKRENQGSDATLNSDAEAKEDEYWAERRRNELLKDQPRAA